jgi:hypothetical protein
MHRDDVHIVREILFERFLFRGLDRCLAGDDRSWFRGCPAVGASTSRKGEYTGRGSGRLTRAVGAHDLRDKFRFDAVDDEIRDTGYLVAVL